MAECITWSVFSGNFCCTLKTSLYRNGIQVNLLEIRCKKKVEKPTALGGLSVAQLCGISMELCFRRAYLIDSSVAGIPVELCSPGAPALGHL